MNILFAVMLPLQKGPQGPTSDLASTRYRVITPGRQLGMLGHHVRIVSPVDGEWPADALESSCDVLIVSKNLTPAAERLARAMKGRGSRIVVDICDDHFDHPEHGPVVRSLASFADELVASTDAMAESIQRHLQRPSRVISDAVEGAKGAPRFAPRLQGLRLAWFGNPSNLGAVASKAEELAQLARRFPLHFLIVTNPSDDVSGFVSFLHESCGGRARIECVPWSVEATWQLLEQSDVVWIPSTGTGQKIVKSPNRLLLSPKADKETEQ